jgi:hypothetical protein
MRRAAVLFAVLWLAGGVTGGARADGTIILNSAQAFQDSINDQSIGGFGSGQGAAAQQQAATTALSTSFPNDNMVPSLATTDGQVDGLLTASRALGAQGQYVSGWTYGYHIDPDLTDYTINLRMYLPAVGVYQTPQSGINMVTIAITSVAQDASNQPVFSSRVWGYDNNSLPGILSPNTTHLQDFSLAAVQGAGAGGSNFFRQDTGFDIRNIWYVSVGYRGVLGSSYPVDPNGSTSLWTGTQSLVVTAAAATPEPNSALVLACCLVGTGLLRSSLRARTRRRSQGI